MDAHQVRFRKTPQTTEGWKESCDTSWAVSHGKVLRVKRGLQQRGHGPACSGSGFLQDEIPHSSGPSFIALGVDFYGVFVPVLEPLSGFQVSNLFSQSCIAFFPVISKCVGLRVVFSWFGYCLCSCFFAIRSVHILMSEMEYGLMSSERF